MANSLNALLPANEIHIDSDVSDRAFVSSCGVTIGANSVIMPNAVILGKVSIEENCVIGPGTIIGFDGFEVRKLSNGLSKITHDGSVVIKAGAELGPANCVERGLFLKETIIGAQTKTGSSVSISHSCNIGPQNLICSGVTLGGAVVTGSKVFVGMNATVIQGVCISDDAVIGASALVAKHVNFPCTIVAKESRGIPNTKT